MVPTLMQVISHLNMRLKTQTRAKKEALGCHEREQPGYRIEIGVAGLRERVTEEGVLKLTL